MNNSLKKVVYDEVSKKVKDADLQKIVGCITYKYASSSLNVYSNASSTTRSLVESFVPKIKEEIVSLQNQYLSYNLMMKEVKKIKKNNFSLYNDSEIDSIYKIYLNKTRIVPFNPYSFDPSMYKVTNLSTKDSLKSIHQNVMKNIALYYMNKYNILPEQVEIISAETDDGIIGKEIIFGIKNISPAIIYNDYRKNVFHINGYVYSFDIDGLYIKMIIK